jgi:hypothetical protein
MTERDSTSLWKLHARLLAAVAVVAVLATGGYIVAGAGAPPGVVAAIAAIGYAIYALLASVFVAGLGPTATPKKVAAASLLAFVLAPIATAAVLTMRAEKPKAPTAAQPGSPQRLAPPAPSRP